jgi:hypothetical protein
MNLITSSLGMFCQDIVLFPCTGKEGKSIVGSPAWWGQSAGMLDILSFYQNIGYYFLMHDTVGTFFIMDIPEQQSTECLAGRG